MTYIAITIFFLLIILIILLINSRSYRIPTKRSMIQPHTQPDVQKAKKHPCILCGSTLFTGDTIHSEHFPSSDGTSIVHTYGCPYCNGKKDKKPRTCPVCKKSMRDKDFLIGKMWKKKNGKQHLHISGCTQCVIKK